MGVTTKGYRISFGGDKNVLQLEIGRASCRERV